MLVNNGDGHAHRMAHMARKIKAAEVLREMKLMFVPTLVELSGFPNKATVCSICESTTTTVKCPECSVSAFLCEKCAVLLHSTINMFHNPLLWKVCTILLCCHKNIILSLFVFRCV